MGILQDLLDHLPADAPVKSVLVGIHWTLVCSRHCGLASTLIDQGPHGHSRLRQVGALHQKSAHELAQWALSDNLLEASIGMAALNSLLEVDESQAVAVNAADVLAQKGQGKNIAIVGHFPFVERLRSLAKNCWVIEKRPSEGDLPAEAARQLLPQADVAAITGTALINHTLEDLLSLCSPQAQIMILGPSTPLSPLLFAHGVHLLSGARVVDEEAARLTIQQGAIFPQVQGVRLLTLAAKEMGPNG